MSGAPDPSGAQTFQVGVADLLAAQRLHAISWLLRWQVLATLGCFGVLGVAMQGGMPLLRSPLALIASFVLGAIGGVLTALLAMVVLLPFKARRTFRMQRSLHGDIEIDWNAETLTASTAVGESRMKWTDYVRWRENAAVILLYHSDNLFQFIPKRVLTPAQCDGLRSAAAAAGVRGARR